MCPKEDIIVGNTGNYYTVLILAKV